MDLPIEQVATHFRDPGLDFVIGPLGRELAIPSHSHLRHNRGKREGLLTPLYLVNNAIVQPSSPMSHKCIFHLPMSFSRGSLLHGPRGHLNLYSTTSTNPAATIKSFICVWMSMVLPKSSPHSIASSPEVSHIEPGGMDPSSHFVITESSACSM